MKKKIIIVIASLCIVFIAIFCASRYGWRLFGFRYCSDPSMIYVEHITVDSNDDFIKIAGNTSASAPAFIGAINKLDGATLYVGMKYNLLLGFFNRDGSFDIQIPIDTKDIEKIIIKGNQAEETIWEKGGPKLLNDQGLRLGDFFSDASDGEHSAIVILQGNNEFILNGPVFTSYSPTGKYSIVDDKLLLTVTDGEEYVFSIRNGNLIFESGAWLENWVEPGSEFKFSE